MPLGYCKVRVNITALVKDGNDSDIAPDDQALSGQIKLVPMVKDGTPLQYDDGGRKKLKVLTTIDEIEIGPMGDIVNGPLDYVTVPAPDSSNTNIASLQWQAVFVQPRYGSKIVTINPIYFYAVAGVDIDLADQVNTAPSSTAVQITRGPRGFPIVDVQTDDAELVFYSGPLDDPDAWLEAGRAPVPTASVSNSTVAPLVANAGVTRDAVDARAREVGDTRYAPVSRAAKNPDEIAVGAITRSANGAATGFGVVWDDGATGVFVGTESTTAPGAIDSYTVTHVLGGVTTTYTQPALTRNASGAVTARPAMTVS